MFNLLLITYRYTYSAISLLDIGFVLRLAGPTDQSAKDSSDFIHQSLSSLITSYISEAINSTSELSVREPIFKGFNASTTKRETDASSRFDQSKLTRTVPHSISKHDIVKFVSTGNIASRPTQDIASSIINVSTSNRYISDKTSDFVLQLGLTNLTSPIKDFHPRNHSGASNSSSPSREFAGFLYDKNISIPIIPFSTSGKFDAPMLTRFCPLPFKEPPPVKGWKERGGMQEGDRGKE